MVEVETVRDDATSAPQTALTIPALVESLLFVASEPVTVAQLAQTLDMPAATIEEGLASLAASYQGRGIRLQRQREHVQLVSAPEAGPLVARFLGVQASARLSAAALEALAIIAYQQPCTRSQVEAVRGVESSGILRMLLARGLIAEVGRLETVGRPILYATTPDFLRQFGLTSLDDLPPLPPPDEQTLPSEPDTSAAA